MAAPRRKKSRYSASERKNRRDFQTWMTICSATGKRAYLTRQAARNALRAIHPDDNGMRVYRCREVVDHFHFGHTRAKTIPEEEKNIMHCGYPAPHPAHTWADELRRLWSCPGTPGAHTDKEAES